MDMFITVIVIVGIVALGVFGVPYLRKHGLLTKDNIVLTDNLLTIAKIIASQLKSDAKNEVLIMFDLTSTVVRYVEKLNDGTDKNQVRDAAIQSTKDILTDLNIELTNDRLKLIEAGVDAALELLTNE